MSKKINAKTITPVSVEMLSRFNTTNRALKDARVALNEKNAPIEEKIAKIKEDRKKAIENGMSVDDAIVKYNYLDLDKELNANINAYNDTVKPLKKDKSEIFKSVNEMFYPSYMLAYGDITKINPKATGEITINKTVYTVEKKNSFYECIKDFFKTLGFTYLEDEKAMNKAIIAIKDVIGGLKLDNQTMGLKSKSKSDMRELLFRAIIVYLTSLDIIVVAEDGTITRK